VSVLVDASQLGLLVAMSGMTALSGAALAKSIKKEDARSAWAWAWSFVATSLLTDWIFWWLA
jgi:hypothetical protein